MGFSGFTAGLVSAEAAPPFPPLPPALPPLPAPPLAAGAPGPLPAGGAGPFPAGAGGPFPAGAGGPFPLAGPLGPFPLGAGVSSAFASSLLSLVVVANSVGKSSAMPSLFEDLQYFQIPWIHLYNHTQPPHPKPALLALSSIPGIPVSSETLPWLLWLPRQLAFLSVVLCPAKNQDSAGQSRRVKVLCELEPCSVISNLLKPTNREDQ